MAIAVAVLGVVIVPGTAEADLGPGATITVSPSSTTPGSTITVSGNQCDPSGPPRTIIVEVGDLAPVAVTDPPNDPNVGDWSLEVPIPSDMAAGTYPVAASCDNYGAVDDYPGATLTVTGPSGVEATVTLSQATVAAGGSVDLAGTGFLPGEQVDVTLFSDPIKLATLEADAAGEVSASVTIPPSTPAGEHTIELRGLTSGRTARIAVTVTAPQALPQTGQDSLPAAGAGFALLGVGTALCVLAERRRRPFAGLHFRNGS